MKEWKSFKALFIEIARNLPKESPAIIPDCGASGLRVRR
jgi:hypothetical protein